MERLIPRNYSSSNANSDGSRPLLPQERQSPHTSPAHTPRDAHPIYARGSRRETHPPIARRPSIDIEAQETIVQIKKDYKKYDDLNVDDLSAAEQLGLPALEQLAQKRFEVKEAILDLLIEKNDCSDASFHEIKEIFQHMQLGHSAAESKLRHKTLNHFAENGGLRTLAAHITAFTPCESDIRLLVSIGEKIAKDEGGYLPDYLCSLHGTEEVPPEYAPLQLPLDDTLDLLKTWLLNLPPQISNAIAYERPDIYALLYSRTEKIFGDAGLLGVRSTKIPAFMQELHGRISSRSGEQQATSIWLGYSAVYLTGKDFSAAQQSALMSTYLALSSNPQQKLLYGGSQIIGKAMQSASDASRLFTTLAQFNHKTLGILFYAAAGGDSSISSRFASLLNPQDMNDPEFQTIANDFADFAGSGRIDTQTKQRLLAMAAEALSTASDPASMCADIMKNLGRIGKTINQEHDSTLACLYQWWLPRCENLEQLNKAAHPDRAFLASLAEMQVIAGEGSVGTLLKALRLPHPGAENTATPLEPIDIPIAETLNWVKNALKEWVKTDDAQGLLEKAEYVGNRVLNDTSLDKGLLATQEVAENCPMLKDICEYACKEKNEQLYLWTQLAGLLMLDTEQSVRESAFFKGMLNGIANFHGEQSRFPVTVCLYLGMRNPTTAAQLKTFAEQFKPKHSLIFAAPLFALADNGHLAGELAALIKLVQQRQFKDTQKALPLLAFISEMALIKSLTAEKKCEIVKMLTEEAANVKNGMTSRMVYVLGLAKLADAGTDDSEKAMAALQAIRQPDDATDAGKTLLKALFSIPDSEIDEFAGKYEQYLKTSRYPTSLLSFASSTYMGIKEPAERKEVMSEIALLAKALVANDAGNTLNQIRYSTTDNAHNALLQNKAPLAWEHWQEEMQWEKELEYTAEDLAVKVNTAHYLKEKIVVDRHVDPETFPLLVLALTDKISVQEALAELDSHTPGRHKDIEKQLLLAVMPGASEQESAAALNNLPPVFPFFQLGRDIKDLRKKLTAPPLSLEKCKGLHASISSKPEDLFLIGTEVIGSCQSIYGRPELNKALPGYVLDGKYLSAQVTNENGSLMARRMLRLLWSEEHNKPVIYVEREYSNPGVPKKIKEACLDLIREKAAKMGALIATDDAELASSEDLEIGSLEAYRTPRPYEYVDALGGIQKYGQYTITDAKLVNNAADVALGDFQLKRYQILLDRAREYVGVLKYLKRENESPRSFIAETRDKYNSEFMIEAIIASENEREPELQLTLCRTAKAFAHTINQLAENGVPGQKTRYLTTVEVQAAWHVVSYEATVVAPGRIYIRGFDSLPKSRAQQYFDAIGNAIKAACQDKGCQIKLDTYATGQQHAPTGCDIFALSFALKSLDEQFDASSVPFKEGAPFDSQLIADEKAEYLPLAYYKHAQPPEIITNIMDNPQHAQEVAQPVNKKEQTLAQRYQANTTRQEVFSFTTREYLFKTFSDSIDAKRIVFYERLIQRLEKKVQQYQETN